MRRDKAAVRTGRTRPAPSAHTRETAWRFRDRVQAPYGIFANRPARVSNALPGSSRSREKKRRAVITSTRDYVTAPLSQCFASSCARARKSAIRYVVGGGYRSTRPKERRPGPRARGARRAGTMGSDAAASPPPRRGIVFVPRSSGVTAQRLARAARREADRHLLRRSDEAGASRAKRNAPSEGRGPNAPHRAACRYSSRAAPGIDARVGLARPRRAHSLLTGLRLEPHRSTSDRSACGPGM